MKDDRNENEDERLRSLALENAGHAVQTHVVQDLQTANRQLKARTEELARSLSLLRATLESTTDGILVTDCKGRITDYNEKYLQMWHLSREAMCEANIRQLVVTTGPAFRDIGAYSKRLDEIYASTPPDTFDVIELPDGRVFERFSRIQSVDGRNGGRVWSFRDITERRHTEQELREERQVLEILNATGTAIALIPNLQDLMQTVTDAATTLTNAELGACFYNPDDSSAGTCRLWASAGIPFEDVKKVGRNLVDPLFGSNSNGRKSIRCDDIRKDFRCRALDLHRSPNGTFPVRSYMAVPLLLRSGDAIGGLCFAHSEVGMFDERVERLIAGVASQASLAIDNARLFSATQKAAVEREELVERERMSRSEAARMGELKDEFLANLSHELRTPLSAIIGWSKVLAQGAKDHPDFRQGLDTIERNARVQKQLIDDLLDMNRIASGKVHLDIQPIAPISFIEAAIESVMPAAEAKGIHIEKALDSEVSLVAGDPVRLQQVVWNLLSNAVKFTPRDGRVQVFLSLVNSHAEISVLDTGIGIHPNLLLHAFERFRQEEGSVNRRYGGLGLGLSIVKHLVELHGGTVRVESPGTGRGATFSVGLPLMAVHKTSYSKPGGSRKPDEDESDDFSNISLAGIKVLVVDDEFDARDLIRRVLSECHAEVLTAASAMDALQLVEDERPNVLVSDIGMPDIDGYELLRRVRALGHARGGKTPAIALTAFARSEDRTRALRAGFQVHVSKPVEPSELVATIASLAGRRGAVYE